MGLEPCVTKLPGLGGHKGVPDSTLHCFLCVQNISWYISFRELINNQGIILITLMQVSALLDISYIFFSFTLVLKCLPWSYYISVVSSYSSHS